MPSEFTAFHVADVLLAATVAKDRASAVGMRMVVSGTMDRVSSQARTRLPGFGARRMHPSRRGPHDATATHVYGVSWGSRARTHGRTSTKEFLAWSEQRT